MEQQKIIDEVNYHKAQTITESRYRSGQISFVVTDNVTLNNSQFFSCYSVDLLPKTLDIRQNQS